MTLIGTLLTYYTWGIACILLYFLFAIAQFFERKSGRRSYYPTFLAALVLLGMGAFRYASLAPAITGDIWGDIARFAGGLILGIFGLLLLKFMMGGRV